MNKEVSMLGDGSGGAYRRQRSLSQLCTLEVIGLSRGYLDIHDIICLNSISSLQHTKLIIKMIFSSHNKILY